MPAPLVAEPRQHGAIQSSRREAVRSPVKTTETPGVGKRVLGKQTGVPVTDSPGASGLLR